MSSPVQFWGHGNNALPVVKHGELEAGFYLSGPALKEATLTR